MARLLDRYPGVALVSGASAGIGEAFARRLAQEGFELVLVARREAALQKLAQDLGTKHSVKVHVVAQDLGEPDGPAQVKARIDALGLKVSLLINNAGYGSWGPLHTLDLDSEARMIDLNCRGTMLMAAHFSRDMITRKNGAIVITASTAALQPCPFFANYAATKAYDLSLAGGLWAELKPHGIDVTAICPGYTRTEFQQVAGIDKEFAGAWRLPEQVVETCLRGLGRGPAAVDGWMNWAAGVGVKFLPRSVSAVLAYNVLKRLK